MLPKKLYRAVRSQDYPRSRRYYGDPLSKTFHSEAQAKNFITVKDTVMGTIYVTECNWKPIRG